METNKFNHEEVEIDLKQILLILLDKIGIIIIVAMLFGLCAFMYTKFMVQPIYQSTTEIYVRINDNDSSSNSTYTDLQTSNILTKDYQVLIVSRPVLETVIAQLDLDMSSSALGSLITVTGVTDTRFIDISVKNVDPWMAKNIADAVRDASIDQIKKIMDIDVVTNAEGDLPTSPVSPSIPRNVAIGVILGVLLSVAIIVIKFMVDDTLKTPEDVEKYLGISVLSSIPMVASERNKKRKKIKASKI